MTFRTRRIKSALFSAAALVLAGTVTAAAGNVISGSSVASGYVLGDADGNGIVSINDVTCIQRVVAEYPADEGYSELAADVDGNGRVDISDATLIQLWLAETETPYPIGEQIEPATEPASVQPTENPTDEDGWGRVIFRP